MVRWIWRAWVRQSTWEARLRRYIIGRTFGEIDGVLVQAYGPSRPRHAPIRWWIRFCVVRTFLRTHPDPALELLTWSQQKRTADDELIPAFRQLTAAMLKRPTLTENEVVTAVTTFRSWPAELHTTVLH